MPRVLVELRLLMVHPVRVLSNKTMYDLMLRWRSVTSLYQCQTSANHQKRSSTNIKLTAD